MKKITFTSILVVAIIHVATSQNIITVDNSPESNAQYSNLQDAVTAAGAGDSIYVHPSVTTYGELSLTKPVTLIGYSHSDPEIRTVIDKIFLQDGASNVNINGFRINSDLGTPPSNSSTITNITIQNCQISSLLYFAGPGVDNLLVQGNVISSFGSTTEAYNNFSDAIIMNNVFTGHLSVKNHQSVTIKNNMHTNGRRIYNMDSENGQLKVQNSILVVNWRGSGSYSYNSSGVVFENCLSWNTYPSRGIGALSGPNNIDNVNPEFVNGADTWNPALDYHLKIVSPAIGKGNDGKDLGIFNEGSFTFINNGYANGIPTVKITSLTPVVAAGGDLEVDITATSY